jgi:N-acetylmuramic acid 6-phosphate (MurNAc-6-P) etherase
MGKVISNLMVDLNPKNLKLRQRAIRIVQELTGAESTTATEALKQCDWVVKTAAARLGRK